MVKFLRTNKYASYVLAIIRIYFGFQWAIAGWGKITGGFSAQGMLMGVIKNPVKGPEGNVLYPWFNGMIQNMILPNNGMISFLVAWGEFLVGLGLIFGCLTTAATFFGMMMNFSYMLAGTVSVNPEYIFFEMFIIFAGFNAGKVGLDYWVIPWIRTHIFKQKSAEVSFK
ncbi:DoxX family protein [Companilactobacillus nodensis]|uniref:DoxX family protein n=1 Tax=Companilactobacillus nodensis DSM 19682 = JCM 14932 = NBRC 107160 TaxID=1423775 RepID=A0A0R1KAM7_9LACO|nr:DoxX family protein [Companilactobacillus nodensis]KRK80427.1 DoxX family protein [Companilactobacillus nodensis DSM 19682 = JCM 14932 = NBRC 107160]